MEVVIWVLEMIFNMLHRVSNWPELLIAFIELKRNCSFKWGENDCCMFGCDWLTIVTGIDPDSEYQLRGKYNSALSAFRILKKLGGVESIVESWSRAHGWERTSLLHAQRGDLVIFQTKNGGAVGVCNGETSIFAGPNGLSFIKTSQCSVVWHIP